MEDIEMKMYAHGFKLFIELSDGHIMEHKYMWISFEGNKDVAKKECYDYLSVEIEHKLDVKIVKMEWIKTEDF